MSDTPERRHFTRVAFDGKAQLIDPATQQHWPTTLIDISLRGALIQRPDDGPDDDSRTYLLQLQLGEDIQLEFEVQIVHREAQQIGLHIEQMDLDSASHLHRLLELNMGDPVLLERELAELIESD